MACAVAMANAHAILDGLALVARHPSAAVHRSALLEVFATIPLSLLSARTALLAGWVMAATFLARMASNLPWTLESVCAILAGLEAAATLLAQATATWLVACASATTRLASAALPARFPAALVTVQTAQATAFATHSLPSARAILAGQTLAATCPNALATRRALAAATAMPALLTDQSARTVLLVGWASIATHRVCTALKFPWTLACANANQATLDSAVIWSARVTARLLRALAVATQ